MRPTKFLGLVAVASVCVAWLALTISPSGADLAPHYYLALGGSDSVGFQPTTADPNGQRTDDGYASDLAITERTRWSDLTLAELGCPGETTVAMLNGGDRCGYGAGSQLNAAVAFLHEHPSTVLLTVDLGYNDLVPCLIHQFVNETCVSQALDEIRTQLPQVLTTLRSAGGPGLRIVGVGHYDPYLRSYLNGPAGQSFAAQSLVVITRLNQTTRAAYAAAGMPVADMATAFDMTSTVPTPLAGRGLVPLNVARTCDFTWECVGPPLGPNKHPNQAGYQAIAEAISDVVPTP